jgi:hypothetical protein
MESMENFEDSKINLGFSPLLKNTINIPNYTSGADSGKVSKQAAPISRHAPFKKVEPRPSTFFVYFNI